MNVKTIYVEITNQCNLNCQTCYNRSGLNKERKEISPSQLEQIIQLFIPLGLKRFLLSGGEPTLHTEFDNILDLIDQYPELSFGIVTNATNHVPKLVKYLNTRPNLTLQVSLDGSNEEYNKKTRGSHHFTKSIEFVKMIQTPVTSPLLKMVISQNNYNDIEDFYKLALSVHFTPEFAFIFKSGNGSSCWHAKEISAQQKLKALKLIDTLNQKYHAQAQLPLCTDRCPFLKGPKDLSLCIKTDGTLQPCQLLYSKDFSLGNVFAFNQKNFESKLNYIVSMIQKRYHMDYGCKKCILNNNCGKGCAGLAAMLNNDMLTDDGDCKFRKLQFVSYQLKDVLPKE